MAKKLNGCKRCGFPLNKNGLCTSDQCPFDSHVQKCKAGWNGHPTKDPNPTDDTDPIPCACPKLKIKCVVACNNANGKGDFFPVIVPTDGYSYQNGDHYETAKEMATAQGGDGFNYVVFDENDGPDFLFDNLFKK